MLYKALLMLHVFSAAVGLLAGFMAMAFRKGSGLHGAAGTIFFVSMLRLIVRGGVSGVERIKRHLWRMSLALLFATASFYPGQARLFPKWLRATNLLYIPHVLLIGAMFFFLYRYSVRKRAQRNFVAVIGALQAQPQGATR
jgi:hypothetical protein